MAPVSFVRDLVRNPLKRVVLRGKMLRPWRRRRFYAFGNASIIHKPIWIHAPHKIAIGKNVVMLHNVWLSVEAAALDRPAPVITIGNNVWVRPHCTIAAAESITIEDGVAIGAYSSIIDTDHTMTEGSMSIMQSPIVTAPVRIGAGTWIAERVAILRGADIGKGCIIGANSVVKGVIPDGSIAVGAPARVVGKVDELTLEEALAIRDQR